MTTRIQIVHLVLIVKQDAPPSQTSRTNYDAETSLLLKLWSLSSPDKNSNDPSFWFLLGSNARSPSDVNMNHKKRFLRRNRHIGHFFLPYFSVRICDQTIVCYKCYRQSFEKLIAQSSKLKKIKSVS